MKIFVWIFVVLVLFIGMGFSLLNANLVTVNYLVGTISVPLAAVILIAFVLGVLLTGLLLGLRVFSLQHRLKIMRGTLLKIQGELPRQDDYKGF